MAAECEVADRLDRGPAHSHRPHTNNINMGHAVENVPEDKSLVHFKGNDKGKAFI